MDSYLPPPRGWDAFEAIVFDVFTQRMQNEGLKRYARSGQEQRGVDILGDMVEVCSRNGKNLSASPSSQEPAMQFPEASEEGRRYETQLECRRTR